MLWFLRSSYDNPITTCTKSGISSSCLHHRRHQTLPRTTLVQLPAPKSQSQTMTSAAYSVCYAKMWKICNAGSAATFRTGRTSPSRRPETDGHTPLLKRSTQGEYRHPERTQRASGYAGSGDQTSAELQPHATEPGYRAHHPFVPACRRSAPLADLAWP